MGLSLTRGSDSTSEINVKWLLVGIDQRLDETFWETLTTFMVPD